jgi:anti-anti-sigma factor
MAKMTRPEAWDGHLLLVHSSEQQRRAAVVPWVRRGLDLGAKILYIEPVDGPAERSLMDVLRTSDLDVGEAVGRGQLQVLPARGEAYDTTLRARCGADALAEGYPMVRCSGEASTAWSVMSSTAHANLEWATDELCRTRPLSILCQYSADLAPESLRTACAMHGGGVRESSLSAWPMPGGIALAGEVDVCNAALLRSCLMAAVSVEPGGGRFVVDLSWLTFLDVSGVRALLTGTSAHRLNGGSVVLRAAQPPVDRILDLLEIEREQGCMLQGPR